jgi:hypothetical protein
VAVQACNVFGGEGAAVGDHQGTWPQQPLGEQPVTLLADGYVAVEVAVETLPQEWDCTQLIHHRSEADLNEFGVIPIAARDVSRRNVGTTVRGPGSVGRSWLRGLVGPVKDEVGRVEVQAVKGEFGEVDGLGGYGSQDGVALGEEGVERPPQAVIVETVGGDVPEEVGPGAIGPRGDVDEGGGLAKSGSEEEAENAAVGVSQLRIWRQVAVDDRGDVEALEERSDEGQRAEGQGLVGEGRSVPGVRHRASAENRVAGRQGSRLEVAKQ